MNSQDWWNLASKTMPDLSVYAANCGCKWDTTKAEDAYNAGNATDLWHMFEQLWEDLPDVPSIRYGAFFPLCDLCSEYDSSFKRHA
jgi:hypothetical protein